MDLKHSRERVRDAWDGENPGSNKETLEAIFSIPLTEFFHSFYCSFASSLLLFPIAKLSVNTWSHDPAFSCTFLH